MASNINILIPPFGNATTSGVRGNFAAAKTEIEALQAKSTDSGQIKANFGSTLSIVNFTANIAQSFNFLSATASLSSFPTTTYPKSATSQSFAAMFDSTRGTLPTGRLIENPVGGQSHIWRVQGVYSNKGQTQTGSLKIRIRNPISGFIYDQAVYLADGFLTDTFNVFLLTIADDASILAPNGYIIDAVTNFTDNDLTVNITSLTRISIPVEIR